MITVYISIGNSDDKLSQQEWSAFHGKTNEVIRSYANQVHGGWASSPVEPWQNACWCVELNEGLKADLHLRNELRGLAAQYRQDCVAWAVAETEFIKPGEQSAL